MKRLAVLACLLALPCFVFADKKEDVEAAVKLLKSKKAADRTKALDDLAKLGEDAKPASGDLLEAMIAQLPTGRDKFLEVLEKISPEISKHVVTLVTDDKFDNQDLAVKSLKVLGKEAAGSVPVLVFLLRSPKTSVPVHRSVLDALPDIAPESKTVIAGVLSVVAAPMGTLQRESRIEAIQTAKTLKIEAKSLLPALLVGVNDQVHRVKVVEAIGELGEGAKTALPLLMKLKFDGQKEMREAAAAAIEKIKG